MRDSAGIAFTGSQYDSSFVLADVVMDWPLLTDEVQVFFAAAGLVVVAHQLAELPPTQAATVRHQTDS